MKLLTIALLFFLSLPVFAESGETGKLRFDGVYQAHPGGGRQSLYIRFYPDNSVIVISFIGSPEEVSHLIDKEFTELPQGKYQIEGENISFTTKAARGEIDYAGRILDGYLSMHIHSRITDFENDQYFDFRPVTFLVDRKAIDRLVRP